MSPHFTLDELQGVGSPAYVEQALRTTALQLLEPMRAELGVPLIVTSGWRSEAKNRAVGGTSDSQHLDGTAVDVVPAGLSLFSAYMKLSAATKAGRLRFGQLIYYPLKGHIHAARATRSKSNQVLFSFQNDEYVTPTPQLLAKFPGAPIGGVAGVVLALTIAGLIYKAKRGK